MSGGPSPAEVAAAARASREFGRLIFSLKERGFDVPRILRGASCELADLVACEFGRDGVAAWFTGQARLAGGFYDREAAR